MTIVFNASKLLSGICHMSRVKSEMWFAEEGKTLKPRANVQRHQGNLQAGCQSEWNRME
jgi:hypothetical protein